MNSIPSIISKHKAYFAAGHTRPLESRLNILRKLKQAVRTHEADLIAALYQDLHKSEQEAYSTEIGIVLEEISFVMKRLRKWSKPKRVKTPLTHLGSKSIIIPEPYGTVLVIAPWNYPLQLALSPLIGAIAAGNTVVLKPSEYTPAVSRNSSAAFFRPIMSLWQKAGPTSAQHYYSSPLTTFSLQAA